MIVARRIIRLRACAHAKRAELKSKVLLIIYTFRKSFGQNHANAGTPLHVSQRLMGHTSITTTREFYLQAADANEREASCVTNPFLVHRLRRLA
ncbi:MAG: tyrosine-type recombinase/integrase [Planctomycetes bacterium]|nr:tyrosine-type recombinase/integrase [Planctomycetota bacterium]MBI3833804.1 tyrosine-type recombinase/integrase [Planctomycetota bacterium]